VLGILVYGSVARGEADRQSDIDLWVLVREHRGRNQRRAAQIGKELASQQFNGERYDFHIVVESPASVPAHTEDIAETVVSGITLSETEEFEKLQTIMEDLIVLDAAHRSFERGGTLEKGLTELSKEEAQLKKGCRLIAAARTLQDQNGYHTAVVELAFGAIERSFEFYSLAFSSEPFHGTALL
jgi:hypothetical protein